MNRTELERRARLWRRHYSIRAAGYGVAAGLLAASVILGFSPLLAVAAGGLIATAVIALVGRRYPRVTGETVADHLNRVCPALEESAGLWLRETDSLPLLERLQLRRLDAAWAALEDRETAGCPRNRDLRLAVGLGTAALAGLVLTTFLPRQPRPATSAATTLAPVAPPPAPVAAPQLQTAELEIEPPAYLASERKRMQGLDADVPAGSAVTWHLAFHGDVAGVSLVVAGNPAAVVTTPAAAGQFRTRLTIVDTIVYQLALTLRDGRRVLQPDVHALQAIRDLPPRLSWREPALTRTVLDLARNEPRVGLRLEAADDHGLAEVTLVATVAKGSGESVSFRELAIPLARDSDRGPAGETFSHQLDLAALGLTPGDELYFHAVAADRRTPEPNRTRSETRFVVWGGAESDRRPSGVALAGLNRLPAYFRSQRQLIIDTERLVAEEPTLPPAEFQRRSDEIGVDQKLLRLRYGEFLGEEFEPASSGAPREAQGMALAGALRGQTRDELNRAAAVERAVEAQHAHPVAPSRDGRPLTMEELVAPFVHVHDNPEAATLFDTHVKTALRAVLAEMWQAEGFLRTGRPAEALPAENRALELLKALQQADRAYVARIGYEPAPIKQDERRLRGELDRIPLRARVAATAPEPAPGEIALAAAISELGATSAVPPAADTASQVEARLVAAARERPDTYLATLELWRRQAQGPDPARREPLLRALWSLAAPAAERPRRPVDPAPALAGDYLDALAKPAGGER